MHSIVSYPDRGPWGNPRYRGNCTGHLVRDLIRYYRPKKVADPAHGSGTTKDVCQALGVSYWGSDLSENFDLEKDPVADIRYWGPELVFFHPPYFRIIRYSGSVWGDLPDNRDLSHEDDWGKYLSRLHTMIEHCRAMAVPSGRVTVLIGDVRQDGAYYSAQAAIHQWYGPDAIEAALIKAQHHVTSDRTTYSGRLIRIMHEHVVVLRAPGGSHG